ncbi:hypothetical protein ACFYXP_14665 [Streptomyces sp. NPDC002466]|uniref:hypothetical protein n=2 Tax=unclassified Streptomyces TaxID=2593676 RepID=UPI0033304AFE
MLSEPLERVLLSIQSIRTESEHLAAANHYLRLTRTGANSACRNSFPRLDYEPPGKSVNVAEAERQKTTSTVTENSESGPETEREKVLVESEPPERENAEAEDLEGESR